MPLKKDTVKTFLIILKIAFLFSATYNSSPKRLMLNFVSLSKMLHPAHLSTLVMGSFTSGGRYAQGCYCRVACKVATAC